MAVRTFLFLVLFSISNSCFGQTGKPPIAVDTSFTDYDILFSELDALIDSLTTPRSFTVCNLSVGTGYFTYENKRTYASYTRRKFTYGPSVAYYNKSGMAVAADVSIIHDDVRINPYQVSLTGSYDYADHKNFITGVALTHFFTKKNLPFYTSPLQNEAYTYFTYRGLWFKPSMALSYGWGSRNAFEQREELIQNIQLAKNGFTRINTKESVIDINLVASIRHDFYFLNVLSNSDYIRVTPQLSFVSGTQQFGFNQTSNTYATVSRTGRNVLFSSENISLDNQLYFQPISFTACLKSEYSTGGFYLQPQLLFNYYFPAKEDKVSASFLINAGFVF